MENRRTSMRLREPAAKLRESEVKVETPKSPPKTRPVGRPKGSKKTKHVSDQDEHTSVVQKEIELKPTTITLPNKLVEGQPLPALPTLQSKRLKDEEWQSAADSGVLVASLPRSRQRWLHEGMFETYWSKSTYKKKKEQMQQEGGKGPHIKEARPSMTKIGTCKMVVEPHIFDVTLFVIKDTTVTASQVQAERSSTSFVQAGSSGQKVQQHHHHMPNQAKPFIPGQSKQLYPAPIATPPQHVVNQPTYGPPTTNGAAPPLRMQSSHNYPPPASHSPAGPTTHKALQPPTTPANATRPSTTPAQASQSPAASSTASKSGSSNPAIRSNQTPKPPPSQSGAPDPVIQMLAQRAQNDHALKQVMKLVAGGQATQAQLNYFQSHIDELTKLVKQRQEDEKRKKAQESRQHPPSGLPRADTSQPHPNTSPHGILPNVQPNTGRPPTQQPYANPRPLYQHSSVPAQPRPPRPVYVPPPLHVLLEFSQNSADRFLFPKNSILEFDARGTSVLASFLVVKTLSQLQNSGVADTKRSKKEAKEAKAKAKAEAAGNASTPGAASDAAAAAAPAESAAASATTPAAVSPSVNAAITSVDKPMLKTEMVEVSAGAKSGKQAAVVEKQFYQPVSVRFESPSDVAVLTALSRVVAPVEQVQKHMLDIASKAERVPVSYLAMRLPREPKEIIL